MDPSAGSRLDSWLSALEDRHLAKLEFTEVRRGIQALSSRYLRRGAALSGALDGAGKRAAFALYYGPLHLLIVRAIVERLQATLAPAATVLDAGCGTGSAGAAWALAGGGEPRVLGIERNRWAASEARWNLRQLDLRGSVRIGDLTRTEWSGGNRALVAGWSVNELSAGDRETVLRRWLDAGRRGLRLLIVEPIARRPVPWWDAWAREFEAAGGRADTWRMPVELPRILARLDRAAGLDHAELTARSLYLGAGAVSSGPAPRRPARKRCPSGSPRR